MAPSQEAVSQPRRPQLGGRHSSASTLSQSPPTDAPPHPQRTHKAQKHVVGGGRAGTRNSSFGKNLNKLTKITNKDGDAQSTTRHHQRSPSGNTTSPTSPRPQVKRNASYVGASRNTTHTVMRKNHSSGHLSRMGGSKGGLKSSKSEVAPPRKSLLQTSKSRHHHEKSTDSTHPTVRFDVGEGEDTHDDAWTEESNSQSPATTRSNTRQNSVVLDQNHMQSSQNKSSEVTEESSSGEVESEQEPMRAAKVEPSINALSKQVNGASSYQPPKPLDADFITSRLLRRSTPNILPQTTTISATMTPDTHGSRTLSNSQGSNLPDTPGRDVVSRFMDGEGSGSAPKGANFLPQRDVSRREHSPGDLNESKRNKSAPNIAQQSGLQSRTPSHRSGATTPSTTPGGDLPSSRTQQKLWLQRASSHIEPQKLVPVVLPRTGGPQLFGANNTHYANTSEGRMDPRVQQRFNQVTLEYRVVRRYRNPLAESLARLEKVPGGGMRKLQQQQQQQKAVGGLGHSHSSSQHSSMGSLANGHASRSTGNLQAYRDHHHHHQAHAHRGVRDPGSSGLRHTQSRDDFEVVGKPSAEDGAAVDAGRASFESDAAGRLANEAEDICRRLWESMEVAAEGED